MPENDSFETRFTRAYRRYLDEVPTEVDALAVARATATQRRFGFGLPRIMAPARVLIWVVLLALLLAAFAASTLFTGSEPTPPVPATQVTGTVTCQQTAAGEWSGPDVAVYPYQERLSKMIQACTLEASDPRVAGDVQNVVDCRYSEVDGVVVGECWGSTVIRNENGSWGGVLSGTTRDEPGSEDVMELVYLGSGEYEGLRFVGRTTTNSSPNPDVLAGTITAVE